MQPGSVDFGRRQAGPRRLENVTKQPLLTGFLRMVLATAKRRLQAAIRHSICGYALRQGRQSSRLGLGPTAFPDLRVTRELPAQRGRGTVNGIPK